MTKEINNKELYQEILDVYKHYMVANDANIMEFAPITNPNAQNPYSYQAIPTLYETVPTIVSNRT